ncbi:BRO-N domain-containing protein [Caulobacter sp. DWR2-3-1b2]|uniref:BRO-N domain-containing protein n=1 Tax=unclassified Caulobacter TaxID=2648921 RepID=UPI003CF8DD4C
MGKEVRRSMLVLAESGLYALINRSDKPEAKVFQRWVNREVLPSIRKTGGYLLNEEARETAHADTREAMPLPMDLAEALAAFTTAQQETNRLLGELLASGAKTVAAASADLPSVRCRRLARWFLGSESRGGIW